MIAPGLQAAWVVHSLRICEADRLHLRIRNGSWPNLVTVNSYRSCQSLPASISLSRPAFARSHKSKAHTAVRRPLVIPPRIDTDSYYQVHSTRHWHEQTLYMIVHLSMRTWHTSFRHSSRHVGMQLVCVEGCPARLQKETTAAVLGGAARASRYY